MTRLFPILAILFLATASFEKAVAQFPESAKITRDKMNQILEFSLAGKSGQDRFDLSHETMKKILEQKTLRSLTLWGTTLSDDKLAGLEKLKKLQFLDLSFSDVTGKSLERISKLNNLVYLRLEACEIEDEHLRHLEKMPQMLMLYLRRTKVTDKGLKHLAKLKKLNALQLSDCRITDKGLKSLGDLPQLQHLWLSKTLRYGANDSSLFTDKSVDYLLTLNSLIDLQIADSRISPAGIQRLRKGLPKAMISTQRIGTTYLGVEPD